MENKFKKDDKVVLASEVKHRDSEIEPMTVLDFTSSGDVVVEVDDWYNKKSKEIFAPHLLMLESEAEQKMSELEKEFEALAPAVSAKVAKAAESFAEAVRLAEDNGFSLSDFHVQHHVRTMIHSGGWSSSAFSC